MTQKTRILVDAHVLDGKPQGTCAYIAGLYGALANRDDVQIFLATEREDSIARWFPQTAGLEWVRLKSHNKYRRLMTEFDRLSQSIAPDFTHFQYITPLRKHGKWINTIHDLLFMDFPLLFPANYRRVNGLLFRISAMRSDVLLTVSDYSREAIARHFGIPESRVCVTPNGIGAFTNAAETPVAGLEPGAFFVYVSRFEPRKNQDGLVRAFRDIQTQLPAGFKLVLVGSHAVQYSALDAEIAKMGNNLQIMSNLSSAELTWLYRHSAAAIYPSRAEGFGIPPLEAIAAGGVSYCSDNTALAELAAYIHGTFNADDQQALRSTLLRAAKKVDSILSEDLRKKAINMYSWERSVNSFAAVLGLEVASGYRR